MAAPPRPLELGRLHGLLPVDQELLGARVYLGVACMLILLVYAIVLLCCLCVISVYCCRVYLGVGLAVGHLYPYPDTCTLREHIEYLLVLCVLVISSVAYTHYVTT